MILTDASIVIDLLRTGDPKLQRLVANLAPAVCGITRAEVLCGARSPAERQKLLLALTQFPLLPMADTLWDALGDNLATLRAAGIKIPVADSIIATVAIEHDIELWTRDQQFTMIQPVLSRLRLFVEPS